MPSMRPDESAHGAENCRPNACRYPRPGANPAGARETDPTILAIRWPMDDPRTCGETPLRSGQWRTRPVYPRIAGERRHHSRSAAVWPANRFMVASPSRLQGVGRTGDPHRVRASSSVVHSCPSDCPVDRATDGRKSPATGLPCRHRARHGRPPLVTPPQTRIVARQTDRSAPCPTPQPRPTSSSSDRAPPA